MTESTPPRGRPLAFDRDAVAATAIGLFGERGYDAVSMDDIAQSAGVSRRSLFRHFASKAELIWDGFAPVVRARSETLAGAASLSPFAALERATLAGADALPDLNATRTRLRIIATHPELIAFGSGRMHTGSLTLIDYLLTRGLEPFAARVLADGFTAAVFDAYLYWATETTDASPRRTLERALALLARLSDVD
ncbi:TetR/AcrR family transcriptional regulator [Gryllotalpicola protaetiae]|uniref:TetR family transcriptional regulator n=1 Tax=Gryllotalpicola protaetiae TaxID=2419771 RepID=A0A387BR91_9MICO|nr:TetR/AcrR family transcriptional regulator [Gryllotalpicola protaetiae]AYG03496.1 TetR family transcriptional regulator [Gryllotalpicola protaetiae]